MNYPVCCGPTESCLFSWFLHCKLYALFYSWYYYNVPPFIISVITMSAFVILRMTWMWIYPLSPVPPPPVDDCRGWSSCLTQCPNPLPECHFSVAEDKAALSIKQIASLEGGTPLLQSGVCKGLPFLARAKHISRPICSQTSQCHREKIYTCWLSESSQPNV